MRVTGRRPSGADVVTPAMCERALRSQRRIGAGSRRAEAEVLPPAGCPTWKRLPGSGGLRLLLFAFRVAARACEAVHACAMQQSRLCACDVRSAAFPGLERRRLQGASV